MTWLGDPVILRRWHVIGAGAVVGVVVGAAILIGTTALRNAATFDQNRRHDLAGELRRESLTKADVARIAQRTAKLERPSSADLLRAIHRAATICRRRPRACARAAAGFRAAAMAPVVPSPRTSATRPRRPPPTRHVGDRGDTSPSTPPTRRPSRPPNASTPTPTSPPTPSRPPAPVQITPPMTGVPLVDGVTVCDGLVDVRCPH